MNTKKHELKASLITQRADARGLLRANGWKDSDILAVIPSDGTGKWIQFLEIPPIDSRITKIWLVETREGNVPLGLVKWFARWRCYVFFPDNATVYERQCLRDIASFCEEQTKSHRSVFDRE